MFNINYDYEKKDLSKLNKVLVIIEDNYRILERVDYRSITKHNISDIKLFLRDEELFVNHQLEIKWGPGNHADIATNVSEHYLKHKDEFTWNSIKEYQNYPIKYFYQMKDVCVHSNGVHTYLSGFYNNVFIIGRYHQDIFGISSCYYVESGSKPGRYNNLCFKLQFSPI